MNGAESMIRALSACGVDLCLANPGTSEMHLVQGLDGSATMRSVLCLFEGVCSGAADGYGRIAGRPAATLLHLGAGLGNAVANLHNARRAGTPLINIVGDHAVHHVPYDAPLTADIEGVARPVSAWVRTARTAEGLAQDACDAVAAACAPRPAPLGGVATLVVPADCAWGPGSSVDAQRFERQYRPPDDGAIEAAAGALDGDTLLLLDGNALGLGGQRAAGRIAAASGCRVYSSTFPARVDSSPGVFPVPRLPYFPEQILDITSEVRRIVLVGAEAPVSFFAYRDLPSALWSDDCEILRLSHRHQDGVAALEALADALGAPATAGQSDGEARPEAPTGRLSTRAVSQALAALVEDDAIVAVDSGGGGAAFPLLQRAVPHSWLNLTGGAIGQGGPAALGAALAAPDRPVYALLGDGGAMYTNQFLWSAARESLKLITVIYSNRSYGILDVEYRRLGINDVGETAASLFDLSRPMLDWVALAAAQGVPGRRADTAEGFVDALRAAQASDGPYLIEAVL